MAHIQTRSKWTRRVPAFSSPIRRPIIVDKSVHLRASCQSVESAFGVGQHQRIRIQSGGTTLPHPECGALGQGFEKARDPARCILFDPACCSCSYIRTLLRTTRWYILSLSLSLSLNIRIGHTPQRPTAVVFTAHKLRPNGTELIPQTGDAFTVKVTNHGDDPVFVAVLFFAGDGSCSCVYPPGGKAAKAVELRKGETPTIASMPNRIFVPPTALSINYVDKQFVDTMAVYITREAADYTTLLDEAGLRTPGLNLRGGKGYLNNSLFW